MLRGSGRGPASLGPWAGATVTGRVLGCGFLEGRATLGTEHPRLCGQSREQNRQKTQTKPSEASKKKRVWRVRICNRRNADSGGKSTALQESPDGGGHSTARTAQSSLGRSRKGGGASRPGPRPAAGWWLNSYQGAKSGSSGGPRAVGPGRRSVPALPASSSLSHPVARPSRRCPSRGPAGSSCPQGDRSTASITAERAPCCSGGGVAPALPCPRPQPHPCFCHGLQTRGRSRGRADPPTASWAGAGRGAAEPPPPPLTPRAGPLPPNLSLPQPLDLERLRGGWDPRVGQEGAPLPLGLTPVSREGRHQGSPGGGTAGRHAPGVGEDCL